MRNKLTEGFKGEGSPDMKYYAFDWDDNIVHMPTKIMVKSEDGDEVGMSTDDFAEHRHHLGKEPFEYKGETIVGFAEDPFRNFRTAGDKDFLIDAMRAKEGPAFDDFREAINNGSVFSIITARGHNPNTLKQAVYNYIINDYNGINKEELLKNLKKYRSFSGEDEMSEAIDGHSMRGFSWLSYGRYDKARFSDEEKIEIEELLLGYGRQWLRNNDFEILESIH